MERLKLKEWGKMYNANTNQKKNKAEVTVLTSDEVNFRTRNITSNEEKDIT